MDMENFLKHIDQQSQQLQEWDDVVQIGYIRDADALIAAAIFGKTLIDMEKPFVIFQIDDLHSQIKKRNEYPHILIGIQEKDLELLSNLPSYIALIQPMDKKLGNNNIVNIASFDAGYAEASFASIAYFMTLAFAPDETLSYIIQLPLISSQIVQGLMSDYHGLHQIIAGDAEEADIIEVSQQFSILGSDIFGITDAFVYSEIPFLPGHTGNERQVTQTLAKAGIVVETSEGERRLSDLDNEEIKELYSTLLAHFAKSQGDQKESLEFIKPKTILKMESKKSALHNTWDFAQGVIDCVNRRKEDIALAVLLGNRSDKSKQFTRIFKEERRALSISFQFMSDRQENVEELKALKYLKTDKKIKWYNAALSAAMGLSSGLVTTDVPFAIISPGPDEMYTIGMQGSRIHNLPDSLKNIIQQVINERELDILVEGSELKAQVSIPEDLIDAVLLDINSKLRDDKE